MANLASATKESQVLQAKSRILTLAEEHPCSSHLLFSQLEKNTLSKKQVAALLRNYDAHASVLRRLLLKAVTLMPEPAVGFILENVRNEYGNGDYKQNHQNQLRDLAYSCSISVNDFLACPIQAGVKTFIKQAGDFYYPRPSKNLVRPAIAAGAITATELLAVREFEYLQKAFAKHELSSHIWFDHVSLETEHFDESLNLALHFVESRNALSSVEYGLRGILDANIHLYDGLLATISS